MYWWIVGGFSVAAGLGGLLKCVEFFRDKSEYAPKEHTHPELIGIENKVLLRIESMRSELHQHLSGQFQSLRELVAEKVETLDRKGEERAASTHTRTNVIMDATAELRGRVNEHLSEHRRKEGTPR